MMVEWTKKKRQRERKGTEKKQNKSPNFDRGGKIGKKKKKKFTKKKIEYEKKRTYPGIYIVMIGY